MSRRKRKMTLAPRVSESTFTLQLICIALTVLTWHRFPEVSPYFNLEILTFLGTCNYTIKTLMDAAGNLNAFYGFSKLEGGTNNLGCMYIP